MNKTIYHYFIEKAEEAPDSIAIVDSGVDVSFGELYIRSRHIARILEREIHSRNSIVAVFLEKSHISVSVDIGIGIASCAYMNIDTAMPDMRLEDLLATVLPAAIFVDKKNANKISNLVKKIRTRVIVLDIDDIENLGHHVDLDVSNQDRLDTIIDTDPACVITTSGSTGTPKGVILNHRGFIDFVTWACSEFDFGPETIVGCLSPMYFDIYSFEISLMAVRGSRLVLIDNKMAPYPIDIIGVVQRAKVNFIFWVPTIMVNIANLGLVSKEALSSLRLIWFAGEVFPTKQFNIWYDELNNATFVNLYGPIEVSLDCTYYIIDKRIGDSDPLPIGAACNNKDVFLLNENGEVCGENEVGEIYVRGTGLALGYVNRWQQTAAAFVQNPLNLAYPEIVYRTGDYAIWRDGLLYFKGRRDGMIKHQGYRIELGEIERRILDLDPVIKNVFVVYLSGKKSIEAICEVSEKKFSSNDIRRMLTEFLPKYMIPRKILFVNKMPMNASGKIDRHSLTMSLESGMLYEQ